MNSTIPTRSRSRITEGQCGAPPWIAWQSNPQPPTVPRMEPRSTIRGKREDILHRMQALSPLLLEAIPLTLEEIFIYELGGADYAVRDIVL